MTQSDRKKQAFHYIGVTGGVGAGKSFILRHLSEQYGAVILRTDDLARELESPGTALYEALRNAFGRYGVFGSDGTMNRARMADVIFSDGEKLREMNAIVHPAVLRAIAARKDEAQENGARFFFLESALLIEYGFDRICDELWYIYADPDARKRRLIETRGYTEEKAEEIMRSQLTDSVFREKCAVVIPNTGTKEETLLAVDREMQRLMAAEDGKN